MLSVTFLLNGLNILLFLYFEYDLALGCLSVPSKINVALFQSVTLISTGFFTVLFANIAMPTIVFCAVFMFIGVSYNHGSCVCYGHAFYAARKRLGRNLWASNSTCCC